MKLSILTFNTLGTPLFAPKITKRYRQAAHLINKSDYTIVCLQELFTYYHVFLFRSILTKFPFVVYQKNPFGPRGGLVIFSKIPVSDPEFKTFSHPKNVHVPFYTKLAQQGILSVAIKEFDLKIVTTHLTSDTTHNLTPENKMFALIRNQSLEVGELINRYKKQQKSVILTADLNISRESVLYKEFLKKTNLVDVFGNDQTPTYYPDRVSYFYRATAGSGDYIFITSAHKNIKIVKTEYVFKEPIVHTNSQKTYLSDHIAAHCILEVNKY